MLANEGADWGPFCFSFIYLFMVVVVVDDVDGGVPRALEIIQISKHKNKILTNTKHTHTQLRRAILDERQFPHESNSVADDLCDRFCPFVVIDIRTAIQCVFLALSNTNIYSNACRWLSPIEWDFHQCSMDDGREATEIEMERWKLRDANEVNWIFSNRRRCNMIVIKRWKKICSSTLRDDDDGGMMQNSFGREGKKNGKIQNLSDRSIETVFLPPLAFPTTADGRAHDSCFRLLCARSSGSCRAVDVMHTTHHSPMNSFVLSLCLSLALARLLALALAPSTSHGNCAHRPRLTLSQFTQRNEKQQTKKSREKNKA